MGIRAYVKRITRHQLTDLQHDPIQIKNLLHVGNAWSYAADLLLEKDWHLLHFMLTGDLESGESALHKVILGGTSLQKTSRYFPYEPPRYLVPEEVKEIALALHQIPKDELLHRFGELTTGKVKVYGMPEPEGYEADDWEDIFCLIGELIAFFDESAKGDYAVLQYMA